MWKCHFMLNIPVKLCVETGSVGIGRPRPIVDVCAFNKILATVKWSLCSDKTTKQLSSNRLQWSRTMGRVWSKPKKRMCNIIGMWSVQSISGIPSIMISVNSITATLHLTGGKFILPFYREHLNILMKKEQWKTKISPMKAADQALWF